MHWNIQPEGTGGRYNTRRHKGERSKLAGLHDRMSFALLWLLRLSGRWRQSGGKLAWRMAAYLCCDSRSPVFVCRSGLREYAVIAAFHDTRFSPIVASELAHLRCDISLLTQFEVVTGATQTGSSAAAAAAAAAAGASSSSAPDPLHDWSIGTHGIQIDFHCPSTARKFNATFLPEVALEQGWSHAETLAELIAKAGFRGNVDAALRRGIKLTRYQSEKESLTFPQYCALREHLTGVPHALALKSSTNSDADGAHGLKHKPTASARATQHINDSSDDDEAEEDGDEVDDLADGVSDDDDALSAAAEARASSQAEAKAQAHQAKKSKTATANGTGARK